MITIKNSGMVWNLLIEAGKKREEAEGLSKEDQLVMIMAAAIDVEIKEQKLLQKEYAKSEADRLSSIDERLYPKAEYFNKWRDSKPVPYQPGKCAYDVYGHQCRRNDGYGHNGLFCKQHAKIYEDRDKNYLLRNNGISDLGKFEKRLREIA